MRFVKLEVDSFRAIRHASLEFGAGLNVVYGPNDLGKSTLAAAIRAALLVVPGSAEGSTYESWHSADGPRVELTFLDAEGHYWRVRKSFGSPTKAELLHSKDGLTFTLDCKAREVEEKLRAMLAWGIPSPGKGAPRSIDSFLANALLADQTSTDAILQSSIAGDPDDTGKVRLTKALASLAEDPLFKKVLAVAQKEVDDYFTQSGQRKRGRASKFTAAAEEVKKLDDELRELRAGLERSSTIQTELQVSREARASAQERLNDGRTRLARVEVHARLSAAKEQLREIDAEAARVDSQRAELQALEARVRESEAALAAAQERCDAAEAAVRAAQEAQRKASSEDSAREQELRRERLKSEAAQLAVQVSEDARQQERVRAAVAARADHARARETVASAEAAVASAIRNRDRLREKSEVLATDVEAARAMAVFARRHQVLKADEEADRARTEAASSRATAEANEARATALDAEVVRANAALAKQLRRLPPAAELELLEQLQRERELAEAALGGGISVTLRPSSSLAICSRVDQEEARDVDVTGALELAAERTLHLAIADLVEVDILAGSAEKRKQVETLLAQWRKSALPVLKTAGVSSLAEVRALHAALATEQQRIAGLQRDAEQLRTAAKSLREMAAVHDQKGASSVSADDRQRLDAALGDHDRETLARRFTNLGSPSETKANDLHAALAKQHAALSADLTKTEAAVQRAQDQLADAQRRASEAEAAFASRVGELAVAANELDAVAATYAANIRALQEAQAANAAQMQALTADAGREITKAAAALEQAQAALVRANGERDAMAAKRDTLRNEHGVKTGALEALREQVARLDRESAALLVAKHERELAAYPADGTPLTDLATATRDVETAQREYERAKEELDRKEGALSQVGGNALRDEVSRLEEARAAAQLRERALEIDADAWKLLHETLRTVENEEGVHLGRALAGPVAARFEELTAGRYRALRLDASLQAEGLQTADANDDDNVLAALSVGTRDQLAALVRLTIADQLRSAVVLDDHLVHSDLARLHWFRDVLQKTAINAQVIVLTCRAEDYVRTDELPVDSVTRDVAAGTIRTIDAARVVMRYGA
jgi:hypothetical protein